MPGFLYHFACSEYVLQNRSDLQNEVDRDAFLLGNVIPDLAKDKDISHFRNVHVNGWKTPNLTVARQRLLAEPNPLRLGCYCHLFLDHFFITKHLAKRCALVFDGRVIEFPRDRVYDVKVFLSERGLYGSYDAGNAILINQCLLPEDYLELPANPPLTGIDEFDNRSDKNWHTQVNRYLENIANESTNVFTPTELKDITMDGARAFLNDIISLQLHQKTVR